MIFNLVSGGGSKKPIIPLYDGLCNFVSSDDGQSGYLEIISTGTLTWAGGIVPETVDMFCVGGGAGGAGVSDMSGYWGDYMWTGGGGGAGGFTTTALAVPLSDAPTLSVTIGAGGSGGSTGKTGGAGGATSIGNLCVAAGGNSATSYTGYGLCIGGTGGSAGGNGGRGYYNEVYTMVRGGNGGTNGGNATNSNVAISNQVGQGQGKPTTDLFGRIHAGGGGGGGGFYGSSRETYGPGGNGGTSDFTNGKGSNAGGGSHNSTSYGGGGYGGGGAGGCCTAYSGQNLSGGAGGQGFAMIAWGDYLALYNAQ